MLEKCSKNLGDVTFGDRLSNKKQGLVWVTKIFDRKSYTLYGVCEHGEDYKTAKKAHDNIINLYEDTRGFRIELLYENKT